MIAKCLIRQKTKQNFYFDYLIPEGLTLEKFTLVEVPFSRRKVFAVVVDTFESSKFAKKEIIRKLSKGPVFTHAQFELAEKIAFEFFSDISSSLFSFMPKLNIKDLAKICAPQLTFRRSKNRKPLVIAADQQFRIDFYIQKLTKSGQNLIVAPEIDQIEKLALKLKKIDPSMTVYSWHSRISSQEKSKIWQKVLNNEPLTVISTRHGLFLPFRKLEKIFIDEIDNFAHFEDQSPAYNAKSAARIVSQLYGAELFYGDTILSAESYAWTRSKRADLVQRDINIDVKPTYKLEKIFSDEDFTHDLQLAKKILITGYFSPDELIICADCGRLTKSNPMPTSCPHCQSIRTRARIIQIDQVASRAKKIFTSEEYKKFTFASFSQTSEIENNFDIAIVPYFDIYLTYPFLNFKYKLVKSTLELAKTGAKRVYLCCDQRPPVIELISNKNIEKFILDELSLRNKDKLPPFTSAVAFEGNPSELKSLRSIMLDERFIKTAEDKYIAFLSAKETRRLQELYQAKKLSLKLRLDSPDFSA